ncbi:MAG: AgmX/PglI C-terminal domain-containing protein, partial [Deltaproteobacteria bacterium]|nr:AgmX/PglI C-terminal domain-containing protein [Deltaproteobacteria bacterium]
AALKPILAAYRERLKKRPKLAGAVTLEVSIDPTGKVTKLRVREDTVKDEPLLACIYWTISDAQFPKADKARNFTYPITLAQN